MAMTSWDIDDERRDERQRHSDEINKKAAEICKRKTGRKWENLKEIEKVQFRTEAKHYLGY